MFSISEDFDARFARWRARLGRSHRFRPRIAGRHTEWSAIVAPENADDPELVQLAIAAGAECRTSDMYERLAVYEDRFATPEQLSFWNLWPGEHYRFLAALARVLDATSAVEIGTYTGMGTLALLAGGVQRVTTFDVIAWEEVEDTALRSTDFGAEVRQEIVDLSDPLAFDRYVDLLAASDLILVDAPKDLVFETRFASLLTKAGARLDRPLFVFDDIRTLPMVRLWAEAPWRKHDATSLAHWSGTGLARMAPPPPGIDNRAEVEPPWKLRTESTSQP